MDYFYCRPRMCRLWLLKRNIKTFVLILVLTGALGTICLLRISNGGSATLAGNEKECLLENQKIRKSRDAVTTVGWTDFPLIIPHVEPILSCRERKLFLVVVVNSAASSEKNRILRMTIRNTWAYDMGTPTKYKWKLFFALGLSERHENNLINRQEASQFNDVIIGNFTDTYKNVVIKTFMSHLWVYSRFSSMYILKTDDDVYIRVSRLAEWLEKQGFPQPFYGGHLHAILTVVRDPRIKWFIPMDVYNETEFPPFSQGSFQVISTSTLPRCFHYTQFVRKPFYTDDAYFGVMARDLGVAAVQIDGFRFSLPKSDKELKEATAFGHMIDSPGMLTYHARYKRLLNRI